ncbi:hypothetical protein BC834DRAFT_825393, partial [Gloeopeniophorella convolvens]
MVRPLDCSSACLPRGASPADTDRRLRAGTLARLPYISTSPPLPQEAVPPRARPYSRYVEKFPGPVGQIIGKAETQFECMLREQRAHDIPPWHPFATLEEWELARWVVKNVGQAKADSLLQQPLLNSRLNPSFHNSYSLSKMIDALLTGPSWTCELVNVKGDRIGEDGKPMESNLELWMRDPLECIRELMGNPAFRDVISYAPERVYEDETGTQRLYDEMWTGDWWWNTQLKLPPGAVVAPVILSSDKTSLSQHSGDKEAWPVYLTIGNIAKDVRCKPSSRAMVLIGYLPVSKMEMFTTDTRSAARYRLYHYCMAQLLKTLVRAGSEGVDMTCPDGFVRRIFPILAAYIADYPEQCLIACCRQNTCPICPVEPKKRGEPLHPNFRDPLQTLSDIRAHIRGEDSTRFKAHNLRPIFSPFWHNLPHANIHTCITPDILHQLHKGVFKDHLVKWCTDLIGDDEIDSRFERMTDFPGLRQFASGISTVSQWTGTEYQEMERVFIGV